VRCTRVRSPGEVRWPRWRLTSAALRCTNVLVVKERPQVYKPMTLARLGSLLTGADDSARWRLVAEFLEEYRWEAGESRAGLLEEEPASTGDEHWNVFLAALAEHVAARDGRDGPVWAGSRSLRRFWFPFNGRAARVDAVVHAPAAFRRRGVFVARQELEVA
jgi:hypothetical protein